MQITILAVTVLILAIVLIGVGLAGGAGRLPRSRWLGIRTQSVQASDDAWRAGHHAASGAIMAAAGPPLLLALALLAMPPSQVQDWLLVYVVVGLVTGGLIALGVRQADRAAEEVSKS